MFLGYTKHKLKAGSKFDGSHLWNSIYDSGGAIPCLDRLNTNTLENIGICCFKCLSASPHVYDIVYCTVYVPSHYFLFFLYVRWSRGCFELDATQIPLTVMYNYSLNQFDGRCRGGEYMNRSDFIVLVFKGRIYGHTALTLSIHTAHQTSNTKIGQRMKYSNNNNNIIRST